VNWVVFVLKVFFRLFDNNHLILSINLGITNMGLEYLLVFFVTVNLTQHEFFVIFLFFWEYY